jgi:DNA ligase-1
MSFTPFITPKNKDVHMYSIYKVTLLIIFCVTCSSIVSAKSNTPLHRNQTITAQLKSKPKIQLAKRYQAVDEISAYWVSEKLDGVRGYWDGEQLMTRNGNIIIAPDWFTQDWPAINMEGELWSQRGLFEEISGCVRQKSVKNECWKNLKLMIFDLPTQKGDFSARVQMMLSLTKQSTSPYLKMIKQVKLTSKQQLFSLLDNTVNAGGEGLMLHKGSASYHLGRTANLLKLKRYQDAEALVLSHSPGKGKYQNMLGAIRVQTNDGVIFNIGTGFSDDERKNPPKIGSLITFKYIGKTSRGVPRFASFIRIKNQL